MAICDIFPCISQVLKYLSTYCSLQVGILLVITAVILWSIKKRCDSNKGNLPIPGLKTPSFSIFGSLYTLSSTTVMKRLSLPITTFLIQTISGHAKLFENEKIWHFDIGYVRFVFLTKAESVEELLRSNKILQKSSFYKFGMRWLGTGLLTSSGSKWRSRRKLLTPAFHFDILKDFLPIIDEQSRILTEILKEKVDEDFVDIRSPVALCSLDIICESALGVHIEAQKNSESEYAQAVLRVLYALMERIINPLLWLEPLYHISARGRQFRKDINTLHNFTRKVIQQKKALLKQKNDNEEGRDVSDTNPRTKKKALMDLLVDHQLKHQDITEEDIREEIDTFVFAGHDTTSAGMTWALYLIGLYPDVQAKLHEELYNIYGDDVERCVTEDDLKDLRYLECVLKESQRLYPSVPMYARQVVEDLDFCGYNIRKGSTLMIYTYALHRDPKTFPNPEKFDPDRFLPENCTYRHSFAYVPFSAGPRNCIGQRFAMMEEKVVITNVLRNFIVKSLDERDKIPLAMEVILRPVGPLRLKFIPKNHI